MESIRLTPDPGSNIQYIPKDSIVYSGTLGPCIGVFIYSRGRKEAYAGHFYPWNAKEGLEEMLNWTIGQFGEPNDLAVFVAGGRTPIEVNDTVSNARLDTVRLLSEYGFREDSIKIKWTEDNDNGVELVLNTETGETLIKNYRSNESVLFE